MENSKRVAVLTGATGGLGNAFLKELAREPLDEIWAFGRNAERLEKLKREYGGGMVTFCMDLTDASELEAIGKIVKERAPDIVFLINNAGFAEMRPSFELTPDEINGMINLNCKAPAILINAFQPYMKKGAKIINVSSFSAFQPLPYLNLYASTKAFLRSYSRALNAELKPLKITSTAVCPYWINTNLLTNVTDGNGIKFKGVLKAEKVAYKALKDAKKGRDMSVCGFHVKLMHFAVKLLPQRLTMKIWLHSVKKAVKR